MRWRLTVWPLRDNPLRVAASRCAAKSLEQLAMALEHRLLWRSFVLRSLLASITTIAMLTAGCAGERPWPAYPVSLSTHFAAQGQVNTIDVLPLDLQLWAEPGYNVDLAALRTGAETSVMGVAVDTLAKRNYSVGAMIDWNGDFA